MQEALQNADQEHKQAKDLRQQSQLLSGSIQSAQDNLMKQNQMLMNLIDDFDKRKGTLIEKFNELAADPSEEDDSETSSLTISDDFKVDN